jgi:RNA polymerase sigma-70 factor (ECF subfamily)
MPTVSSGFTESDEVQLIARIQAGDTIAFLELYQAVYPRLLRFAYQLTRSRDTAEDAVQSVFVRIWTGHTHWRPNGPLQPYLYRAVRNHIINTIHHEQVVERAEAVVDVDAPYGMGTGAASIEATLESADIIQAVAAAIKQLPERQRTSVLLRWYDGCAPAEIARIMGVSRQAIEKLLRTAEARLRAVLADRFER